MNKNNKITIKKQITISKDSYPFTLKSKINKKSIKTSEVYSEWNEPLKASMKLQKITFLFFGQRWEPSCCGWKDFIGNVTGQKRPGLLWLYPASASHGCPLICLHSASIEVTKSVFKKTVKNVQRELTCFCHAFVMLSKFYLLACYTSHNWCTVKMFQVEINCLAHHTKPKTPQKGYTESRYRCTATHWTHLSI